MEKKTRKKLSGPKLSKTFGRVKEPEENWLEMFNNFLDNHDHYITRNGKWYFIQKGKKPKLMKVVNVKR